MFQNDLSPGHILSLFAWVIFSAYSPLPRDHMHSALYYHELLLHPETKKQFAVLFLLLCDSQTGSKTPSEKNFVIFFIFFFIKPHP